MSSSIVLQQLRRPCAVVTALPRVPAGRRPCAVVTASAKPDRATTTINSLDDLLGSRDEEPVDTEQEQGSSWKPFQILRVPGWAWTEIREPRVVPLASNVLYYLLLIVYTSYYVVQLADGQQAADDLLLRLTNDHAAVASGDSLRLFTAFFVSDSLQQLIIGLLGLATVAAELESLLGYSTFWAVWCVTVLAGSLADAALSGLPITAGPAPAVGGVAAALLAHHVHNWRVEQMLAQAKVGQVPQQLIELEDQYNRQQRQQWAAEAAAAAAFDAPSISSSSSIGTSQQQQHLRSQSEPAAVELVESELEGPLGMSLNVVLPREGKAFITLGGAAVGVVSALQDAANSDAQTDWPALCVGFAIGAVLGWLACPVYAVELEPASSRSGSSSSEEEAAPDLLLPVLRDMRAPAARANAVVGTAAILFASLGVWLMSEGMFV